jgi:very-short-patch-repair endonuclease
MDKADYILRSLSKVSSKRWEHYVINRVYHRLNDPEIEFVCQQCIRKDDKFYLADLYFPQFDLYLEIDEAHHDGDDAIINDARRRFDIAEASGLTEMRISTSGASIESVEASIEEFIELLRRRKAETREFDAWDYEDRYKPDTHIARGYITIGPHSAFRYQKDALRCFGYTKGHFQRGAWNLPPEVVDEIELSGACMVWFPRLYEQKRWKNSLSEDGCVITEINKNPEEAYSERWDKRIVMARSRNSLNQTLYRFVGVFEVIPEYSSGSERRFRRIAKSMRTVSAANLHKSANV